MQTTLGALRARAKPISSQLKMLLALSKMLIASSVSSSLSSVAMALATDNGTAILNVSEGCRLRKASHHTLETWALIPLNQQLEQYSAHALEYIGNLFYNEHQGTSLAPPLLQ